MQNVEYPESQMLYLILALSSSCTLYLGISYFSYSLGMKGITFDWQWCIESQWCAWLCSDE